MAAPLGNQNGKKAKRWSNAVERAIDAYPEKPLSLSVNKGLDEAAFTFVAQMMTTKDISFFKEFGDRMEGKPAQAIIGGGEDDPPFTMVLQSVDGSL